VILCHDIHPGTIAAMPELIDKLHAAGYKFQTVSGLLAMQEQQQVPARRRLRGTTQEANKEEGA
jgi:hypothetical protein